MYIYDKIIDFYRWPIFDNFKQADHKKNNYWIVFHSEPAIAFGFGFRFVAFFGLRTQTLNLQNNKGPHFVQHIWNQYITLFYYFCSKQLSCTYIPLHNFLFSLLLSIPWCLLLCVCVRNVETSGYWGFRLNHLSSWWGGEAHTTVPLL